MDGHYPLPLEKIYAYLYVIWLKERDCIPLAAGWDWVMPACPLLIQECDVFSSATTVFMSIFWCSGNMICGSSWFIQARHETLNLARKMLLCHLCVSLAAQYSRSRVPCATKNTHVPIQKTYLQTYIHDKFPFLSRFHCVERRRGYQWGQNGKKIVKTKYNKGIDPYNIAS